MKIVENLNEKHINQLYELYQDIWFTQGRELEDIKEMLKNSYLVLGFVEDGNLVGFCRAISDGVYKAFLFDVIVKESERGNGTGKYIVESILRHDKIKNVKHVELYCPEKVTPFYEKFNFKIRTSLLMRNERL
jgi:predicted GNAT family N-acyltransferase